MRNPTLLQLAYRWRAFRRAENGNVAITFAVALIPLLGLVGMAIDYTRANGMRASMLAAADSTALAVSKDAPSETATALQTTGDTYFRALFTRTDALGLTTTTVYTTTPNPQVVVTASASIKPRFMSMPPFNIGSVPLKVSSTTTWGMSRLRVALVLDNTGSMGQYGKLTALKTATKNLLSQLQGAATNNGDVYVSIIPFVKDIAVDPANYSQSWIDWTDWAADSNNQTCTRWDRWGNCTASTVNNHNTWNGCITDRGKSGNPYPSTAGAGNDQTVSAPVAGNAATLYPAEQYSSCPQAVMGLNYNWTAMTTEVNNMAANGSTNQPIGLVWGWLSLVGGGPFTVPAMDPNYQYQQIIILLTDGLNTADRWYGNGSSTSTQVDSRMYDSNNSGAGSCKNIKAAGIIIYTIQVNTDGDPTSTLLQNCASNSPNTTDHFYLLTSANQIITTFQAIGTKLSQLRIAK